MLARLRNRIIYSDFGRVFNFQDAQATGRSMLLVNIFLSCIASVFVGGAFYTGFLSLNGIDIVRVGIIAFIPYIAWGFSIFSPLILSRFRRRRALMLFNHVFYYLCVVLATTIMPMLVTDYAQRTFWFAFFLLLGNISNALLASGNAAWHIHFLPVGEDRNVYFSYTNLISTFIGTVVAISSSVLADSLAGSPRQGQVITILRFIAFGMFLFSGCLLYLVPKEFPYPKAARKIAVLDILIIPIRARKFLLTALIVMLWNLIAGLNASTWTYYVLNTVGIGYTYLYIASIVCAVGSVFLMKRWRWAIKTYSWLTMLFVVILAAGLLEFPIAFSTSRTIWVYVLISILQGFNNVGINLVFANLFYVNLPKDNTDVFITFWNLSANISALLGSILGTWFISMTEPHGPWTLFGLPFYGSQFLVWIKFVFLLGTCAYIRWISPQIKPDD